MRIPIGELPQPILERLRAIQANPRAHECFYKRESGRGWAIFGLVVVGLGLLMLVPFALSEYLFPPMAVITGILLGAITFYSVSRIRRFGRAPLKPMMVLNPLYLVRTNLDFVSYHALWSELTDLKITHHYTNGAYTHTMFDFKFKRGAKESVPVAPKKVAEQLAETLEAYRQRILQALQAEDLETFVTHDLFLELRDREEQDPSTQKAGKAVGRRHLLAWAGGGAAGAVAGLLLAAVSYASAQSKQVEYCYGVEACEAYFDSWAVPLYTTRARQKLLDAYKQRWERDRKSARALREMAKLQSVPQLLPAQEKEVLALYRDGSQRELRALYQQAIDKYRAVSSTANPAARDALLRMLELARDRGYYRVRVSYKGFTDKVQDLQPSAKLTGGRPLVPMAPSFTDSLNRSREALITDRIQRAFSAIVPQDVLEFPDTPTAAYRSLYGRDRARQAAVDRALAAAGRLGIKTPPGSPPSAELDPELELKVGYVVFPSGTAYVNRRDPSKLYVGVGFDWLVRIQVKEQSLYTMRQQSYPPPRFTVTSYGSRYAPASLGDGQVYSTMATTAFDDFSRLIVGHFGIGAERPRAAPDSAAPASTDTAPRTPRWRTSL